MRRRAFLAAALAAVAGLAGCGHRSGGHVHYGSPYNLVVDNFSFRESAGVLVDGDYLGSVAPRSTAYVWVVPGPGDLDLVHGASGLVDHVGTFQFTDHTVVHAVFDH